MRGTGFGGTSASDGFLCINLNTVDKPVCIYELGWILLDVIDAVGILRRT